MFKQARSLSLLLIQVTAQIKQQCRSCIGKVWSQFKIRRLVHWDVDDVLPVCKQHMYTTASRVLYLSSRMWIMCCLSVSRSWPDTWDDDVAVAAVRHRSSWCRGGWRLHGSSGCPLHWQRFTEQLLCSEIIISDIYIPQFAVVAILAIVAAIFAIVAVILAFGL